MVTDVGRESPPARRFVVAAIPSALISWNVGFELGAFDIVSYHRLHSIFVVCIVVLIATFVWPTAGFATSWSSRVILALPAVYIVADALLLTDSVLVANVLTTAIVLTLPYAAWVVTRIVGSDVLSLSRREQVATVAVVAAVGLMGLYVGIENDRFLTCRDFERMGEYLPDDCSR